MKIGIVYPQTEFGFDTLAIRDFAQTAESLGFDHILAYDHVLGANPERPGGWQGPYTDQDSFMDPFILFSYMAAITNTIEFTTGILILPQRQTALVAKQAACLDVLCRGRLRLGIGIGWNEVEYEALGMDFENRGTRSEEQIQLLRQLWVEPLVTFYGKWHTINDAGLNPLPVQRPIPIWFGGHADRVLRRIANMGDGWITNHKSIEEAQPSLDKLSIYLEEAGRPSEELGLEVRLNYGEGDLESLAGSLESWRIAGATHLSFNTMRSGFKTNIEHIGAMRRLGEHQAILSKH